MNSLKKGASLQNGKYIIGSTLGQGGFGITYEAEQVSLGRRVAVKEFFMKDICNRDEATSHVSVPSVGSKELVEKFRAKFIREARMIAALDHEHIVKIHDVFEENGTAYYVMEYLGGGSLGEGVKAGKAMPEQEAISSIRQIASALEYLHKKGIIHFDVKPSNVLRTEDGKLKLIDFGISKHYDEAGVQTSSTPVGISKGYAPLEQYQQGSDIKSFTPATDIYALGATLYALLTGSNPPESSLIYEDGVPAIEGISPVVMHAIEKAMQPRRKERPQSVGKFLALLDGIAEDDEETFVAGAGAKTPKTKSDNEKKPAKPEKPKEQQKLKETKVAEKKPFPKWLYGVFAGVAVAVLVAALLNHSDKIDVPDIPLVDSSSVVMEAVPEAPAVVELKNITLNKTTLELEEGSSATLTVKYTPGNATDKATTWKSSDASVAKVSNTGKVTAVKAGSAAIIASCDGKDAYCNVTVKAKEIQPSRQETAQTVLTSTSTTVASASSGSTASTTGTHNGHEWVDLGLSVKWATCNVGATIPEDYGNYFAWGEIKRKSVYAWYNLRFCNDEKGKSFSKYNINKGGTRDKRTILDLTDDAANANWGGDWRLPSKSEFQELIDKCTWTWTKKNGITGYVITSKINHASIFIPASGARLGEDPYDVGDGCDYWTRSLYEDYSDYAWHLDTGSDYHRINYGYRAAGLSVRPVVKTALYEETLLELDKTELEQRMKMLKEEKEAYNKLCEEEAKNAAPKFGLG